MINDPVGMYILGRERQAELERQAALYRLVTRARRARRATKPLLTSPAQLVGRIWIAVASARLSSRLEI